MQLVQIPDLPVVWPLIARRVTESGIEHRVSPDKALDEVHRMLESGTGAAITDDILNPSCVGLLQFGSNVVFQEKTCYVLLIYVEPEKRTSPLGVRLAKFIEAQATVQNCDVINTSSWIYRGGEDISAFWKALGYEEQERVFVKHLNGK